MPQPESFKLYTTSPVIPGCAPKRRARPPIAPIPPPEFSEQPVQPNPPTQTDLKPCNEGQFHVGTTTAESGDSGAMGLLLDFAEPRLAAAVAFFGFNLLVRPLLSKSKESADGLDLGASDVRSIFCGSWKPSILGEVETRRILERAKLSVLLKDVTSTPQEFQEHLDNLDRQSLDEEVSMLQEWRSKASLRLKVLQKRSALSYLGLPVHASQDDISKTYKRLALQMHPDKGGEEKKFQMLQEMKERLTQSEKESCDNEGDDGLREVREREEASNENEHGNSKEKAMRRDVHKTVKRLWASVQKLKEESINDVKGSGHQPVFSALRHFVESFAQHEIDAIPRGDSKAAELKFYEFLKQGAEILSAAALLDARATRATVAISFTHRLSCRSGCHNVDTKCLELHDALTNIQERVRCFIDIADKEFRSMVERELQQRTISISVQPQPESHVQPDSKPLPTNCLKRSRATQVGKSDAACDDMPSKKQCTEREKGSKSSTDFSSGHQTLSGVQRALLHEKLQAELRMQSGTQTAAQPCSLSGAQRALLHEKLQAELRSQSGTQTAAQPCSEPIFVDSKRATDTHRPEADGRTTNRPESAQPCLKPTVVECKTTTAADKADTQTTKKMAPRVKNCLFVQPVSGPPPAKPWKSSQAERRAFTGSDKADSNGPSSSKPSKPTQGERGSDKADSNGPSSSKPSKPTQGERGSDKADSNGPSSAKPSKPTQAERQAFTGSDKADNQTIRKTASCKRNCLFVQPVSAVSTVSTSKALAASLKVEPRQGTSPQGAGGASAPELANVASPLDVGSESAAAAQLADMPSPQRKRHKRDGEATDSPESAQLGETTSTLLSPVSLGASQAQEAELKPNPDCTRIAEELERTEACLSWVPDMTRKKTHVASSSSTMDLEVIEDDGKNRGNAELSIEAVASGGRVNKPKMRPSLTARLDSALVPSPSTKKKKTFCSELSSESMPGAPNLRVDRNAAHRMIVHYANIRKGRNGGDATESSEMVGSRKPKPALLRRKVLGQAPRTLLVALAKVSSVTGDRQVKDKAAALSRQKQALVRKGSLKEKEIAEQEDAEKVAAKQALALLEKRKPQATMLQAACEKAAGNSGKQRTLLQVACKRAAGSSDQPRTMLQAACERAAGNSDRPRSSISGTAITAVQALLATPTAQHRRASQKPRRAAKKKTPEKGVLEVVLSDSDGSTESFDSI